MRTKLPSLVELRTLINQLCDELGHSVTAAEGFSSREPLRFRYKTENFRFSPQTNILKGNIDPSVPETEMPS